jgi:hypothetical protein
VKRVVIWLFKGMVASLHIQGIMSQDGRLREGKKVVVVLGKDMVA